MIRKETLDRWELPGGGEHCHASPPLLYWA